MFCSSCGREIEEGDAYCGTCGEALPVEESRGPNVGSSLHAPTDDRRTGRPRVASVARRPILVAGALVVLVAVGLSGGYFATQGREERVVEMEVGQTSDVTGAPIETSTPDDPAVSTSHTSHAVAGSTSTSTIMTDVATSLPKSEVTAQTATTSSVRTAPAVSAGPSEATSTTLILASPIAPEEIVRLTAPRFESLAGTLTVFDYQNFDDWAVAWVGTNLPGSLEVFHQENDQWVVVRNMIPGRDMSIEGFSRSTAMSVEAEYELMLSAGLPEDASWWIARTAWTDE